MTLRRELVRRDTLRPFRIAAALAAAAVAGGAAAMAAPPARGVPAAAPSAIAVPTAVADGACVLAVLSDPMAGEAIVTERDAEVLRALLQPPPSRAEARRLAVDAALAHLWARGWVAAASARGRLVAWRAFNEAIDALTPPGGDRAAAANGVLAGLAARAGLASGPCLDAVRPAAVADAAEPPAPDPRALRARDAGHSTLLRLAILPAETTAHDDTSAPDPACDAEDAVDLGLLPASHLESRLAVAALAAPRGGATDPIPLGDGMLRLRVLQRIDP